MKFDVETLTELSYGGDVDGYIVLEEELNPRKRRWETLYDMVFKFEDKLYLATYSVGNTEYQDVDRFNVLGHEMECPEVVPVEKTIVTYEVKR